MASSLIYDLLYDVIFHKPKMWKKFNKISFLTCFVSIKSINNILLPCFCTTSNNGYVHHIYIVDNFQSQINSLRNQAQFGQSNNNRSKYCTIRAKVTYYRKRLCNQTIRAAAIYLCFFFQVHFEQKWNLETLLLENSFH